MKRVMMRGIGLSACLLGAATEGALAHPQHVVPITGLAHTIVHVVSALGLVGVGVSAAWLLRRWTRGEMRSRLDS